MAVKVSPRIGHQMVVTVTGALSGVVLTGLTGTGQRLLQGSGLAQRHHLSKIRERGLEVNTPSFT